MPRKKIVQSDYDIPDLPVDFWAQAFQLCGLRSPSGTRLLSKLFAEAVDAGPVLNLALDGDFIISLAAAAAARKAKRAAEAAEYGWDFEEEEEEDENKAEEWQARKEDAQKRSVDSLQRLLSRRMGLRRMNIMVGEDSYRYANNSLVPVAAVIGDKLAATPTVCKLSLVGDRGGQFPEDALVRMLSGAAGVRSLHVKDLNDSDFLKGDTLQILSELQTLDMVVHVGTMDFAAALPSLQAVLMQFTGPTIDFSGFSSQLTSLKFACMDGSALTGLGTLKSLVELEAAFGHTGGVAEIAQLTCLTKLYLIIMAGSDTDLAPLSSLVLLRQLDTANTSVVDLGFITHLTALTRLRAHELPAQFPATSSTLMQTLAVHGYDLQANPGSMERLCSLGALRSLDLRECKGLGGDSALALSSLTALTALNLRGAGPSVGSVRELRKCLTQLVVLDVSNNHRSRIPACWTVGAWEDSSFCKSFIHADADAV